MKKEEKIKACEVSFSTMTGINFRNITFQDYDKKIFVIGRERTKRQYRDLDNISLIKGHLNVESLNDRKFYQPNDFTKQRCFPPSLDDLKRDLSLWDEVKELDKIDGCCGIGIKIEEEIKKMEF